MTASERLQRKKDCKVCIGYTGHYNCPITMSSIYEILECPCSFWEIPEVTEEELDIIF